MTFSIMFGTFLIVLVIVFGTNIPDAIAERIRKGPRGKKPCEVNKTEAGSNPQPSQTANYMQHTGEGTCFAHGPYKNTDGSAYCPKWPACATDPQKPEFKTNPQPSEEVK